MKKVSKKVLVNIGLACGMAVSVVPTNVFANENTNGAGTTGSENLATPSDTMDEGNAGIMVPVVCAEGDVYINGECVTVKADEPTVEEGIAAINNGSNSQNDDVKVHLKGEVEKLKKYLKNNQKFEGYLDCVSDLNDGDYTFEFKGSTINVIMDNEKSNVLHTGDTISFEIGNVEVTIEIEWKEGNQGTEHDNGNNNYNGYVTVNDGDTETTIESVYQLVINHNYSDNDGKDYTRNEALEDKIASTLEELEKIKADKKVVEYAKPNGYTLRYTDVSPVFDTVTEETENGTKEITTLYVNLYYVKGEVPAEKTYQLVVNHNYSDNGGKDYTRNEALEDSVASTLEELVKIQADGEVASDYIKAGNEYEVKYTIVSSIFDKQMVDGKEVNTLYVNIYYAKGEVTETPEKEYALVVNHHYTKVIDGTKQETKSVLGNLVKIEEEEFNEYDSTLNSNGDVSSFAPRNYVYNGETYNENLTMTYSVDEETGLITVDLYYELSETTTGGETDPNPTPDPEGPTEPTDPQTPDVDDEDDDEEIDDEDTPLTPPTEEETEEEEIGEEDTPLVLPEETEKAEEVEEEIIDDTTPEVGLKDDVTDTGVVSMSAVGTLSVLSALTMIYEVLRRKFNK